jgi:hypothetical protein
MESERWAGAVDTVGGDTLAGIIRALKANASVAACGLAGGTALNTTVLPFILRGVNLLGINSVFVTPEERREVWRRLSSDLPLHLLDQATTEEPLEQIFELGEKILAGARRSEDCGSLSLHRIFALWRFRCGRQPARFLTSWNAGIGQWRCATTPSRICEKSGPIGTTTGDGSRRRKLLTSQSARDLRSHPSR